MLTKTENFGFDWKFLRDEHPDASAVSLDDSSWETVELPHDWSIFLPFENRKDLDYHGFLAGGTGWYRKHFRLPEIRGRVFLAFHGVYRSCRVWCNGIEAGGRLFGYNGFELDLTSQLSEKDDNVIAVRVDAPTPSCRWYSGAGINRGVDLIMRSDSCFPHHPLHITSEVEGNCAKVTMRLNTVLTGNADAVTILEVADPSGAVVYTEKRPALQHSKWDLTVEKPCLWSPETPELYRCAFTLQNASEEVLDRTESTFGLRTIEFTRKKGMFINGRSVRLQGVAMHEGFGCLGTAFSLSALKRQLDMAQSIGANAIRTAHNPFPEEIADECDRRGLLLMPEVFDEWRLQKKAHSCGEFFETQYESSMIEFLHTFRNHPSVIILSIGNEIWEQGYPECGEVAMKLRRIVDRESPGIAVSAGCDHPAWALANGMGKALDIFGINYNLDTYEETVREMPVFGSETVAALTSRGDYVFDSQGHIAGSTPDYRESSYPIVCMQGGTLPEQTLLFQKRTAYSAGEFVWCLMDYLGEGLQDPAHPRKYEDGSLSFYPVRSCFWGLFDTCGFPKDIAWLYRSAWTKTPCAHILPHWTWRGREGELIPVWVYGNFHTGELRLNGRSLGKCSFTETPERLHLEWLVPYEAGTLEVTGYDESGNAVAADRVRTAGEPARIELESSVTEFSAGEHAFITARITDTQGTPVPDAANLLTWDVSGAGVFEASDNGNPVCHESFRASRKTAFHGMALLVVRADRGGGTVNINASSEGLTPGVLQLHNKRKA